MRALAAVVALVLGAVVAIAAIAVHQLWWGLLLGVAAVVSVLFALPGGWWRAAYAAGFVGLLLWAMTERPEGDYVIPGDGSGYTLLGLGLLVLVVALATLPTRRSR